MYITFPSWDFYHRFKLRWWWSLALHGALLLGLPSYKLLHVSGRFSWRSDNWKLSLSDQLNKICCLLWKRQLVLQQVFRLVYDTLSIGTKYCYRIERDLHENCTWTCYGQTAGLTKGKATRTAPHWLLHASLNAMPKAGHGNGRILTPLMYMKYSAMQLVALSIADKNWH